jgi:hypothetical protein
MQLKNMTVTTDLVLRVFGLIPVPVFHNLGKAKALKIAFWHLAIDQIPGCYVEFGVASGNSMRSAEIAEKRSHSKSLGVMRFPRHLYGFDTFESFASDSSDDKHPTWEGDNFSVSVHKVRKRFRRQARRITFFQMDASTLNNEIEAKRIGNFISEDYIALALLDMDLGSPTLHALNWIHPKIQNGTILIFDEFLAYKGNPDLGESGALNRFIELHPEISYRQLASYGDGGAVLQITIK